MRVDSRGRRRANKKALSAPMEEGIDNCLFGSIPVTARDRTKEPSLFGLVRPCSIPVIASIPPFYLPASSSSDRQEQAAAQSLQGIEQAPNSSEQAVQVGSIPVVARDRTKRTSRSLRGLWHGLEGADAAHGEPINEPQGDKARQPAPHVGALLLVGPVNA